MSSNNEPTGIVIKKNCLKCKVYFMNLLKYVKCCYSIPKSTDEDNDNIQLSNTDFNKKRTPSMNDYVVNSYINNKTDDKIDNSPSNVKLEVPKSEEIVRV